MATIQVQGVLTDPTGNFLPSVSIRLTCVIGSSESLQNSEAIVITDSSGNYDFTVKDGTYDVFIKYTNEYLYAGDFTINDSVTTPIELDDLISNYPHALSDDYILNTYQRTPFYDKVITIDSGDTEVLFAKPTVKRKVIYEIELFVDNYVTPTQYSLITLKYIKLSDNSWEQDISFMGDDVPITYIDNTNDISITNSIGSDIKLLIRTL